MKPVKEFTKEEVRDFILLCLRTNWTTLFYADQMEASINAAIAKQRTEREASERADLPVPLPGDGDPNELG